MAKYSDGLDEVAAALASSSRRQIVERLSSGPATSSQLAAELGIGLPALAKHLDSLRSAGLIASSKTGRVVSHTLRPQVLAPLSDWITTRTEFWHGQLDHLADSLEEDS